jgi:hypothetical protein
VIKDNSYEKKILAELAVWQSSMQRPSSATGTVSKKIQTKINKVIPEKVHQVITKAIKELTRGVIFGVGFTTYRKYSINDLHSTEDIVKERINFYTSSSAAEGTITGFGGFLSAMADLPLWLTRKMKMLF